MVSVFKKQNFSKKNDPHPEMRTLHNLAVFLTLATLLFIKFVVLSFLVLSDLLKLQNQLMFSRDSISSTNVSQSTSVSFSEV